MEAESRKWAITRAFGGASDYDRAAEVQHIVAQRLADRIAGLPPDPAILEIGCGTGLLGRALMPRYPTARWLLTDLSETMVARGRQALPGHHYLVMDGERPALRPGSFDLVCASLAVQWFSDPGAGLARLFGLLRPGGLLAFSTMAPGSLAEWRVAHGDLPPGTPDYPAPETLIPAGADALIETEALVRGYADAFAFLHTLKAIGAGVAQPGHRPLTPGQLRSVMRRFESGGASATWRIAYGLFRRGS